MNEQYAILLNVQDSEERIPTAALEKDIPTGPLASDPATLASPNAYSTEAEIAVGEVTCPMLELDF